MKLDGLNYLLFNIDKKVYEKVRRNLFEMLLRDFLIAHRSAG